MSTSMDTGAGVSTDLDWVGKAFGSALSDTSFLDAFTSDSVAAVLADTFKPPYPEWMNSLGAPMHHEWMRFLGPTVEQVSDSFTSPLAQSDAFKAPIAQIQDTIDAFFSDALLSKVAELETLYKLIIPPLDSDEVLPSPVEGFQLPNLELSKPGSLIVEVHTNDLRQTSTWLSENWPVMLMFTLQVALSIFLAFRTDPQIAALLEELRELQGLLLKLVEIGG